MGRKNVNAGGKRRDSYGSANGKTLADLFEETEPKRPTEEKTGHEAEYNHGRTQRPPPSKSWFGQ